jgi:hypothetical protein
MTRRIAIIVGTFVALVAAPASAQTTIDAAVAVSEQGYYVDPGADISESRVSDLVTEARNAGYRLSIVVLEEEPSGGATTFAGAVFDAVGGPATIIVLTEDGFVGYETEGEFERSEVEAALDAADAAGGDDVTYLGNVVGSLLGAPQPAPQPAPAQGGGGGGGLWVLVIIVAVIVGVAWLAMRRSKKAADARAAGDIAGARKEIQAQLDSMANDILDLESSARLGGAQAVEYFEAGADVYQQASEQFEKAQTLPQLEALSDQLDEAAWQLDAAQAIVEGDPIPPKPAKEIARCFFDPTHRGPMTEAVIRTSAGDKEVRVCKEDAAKLAAGRRPDPRMIDVGGRRVPAPQAPRSHGGGGLGGLDLLSILVGGASQALPDLLGRRSGGGLLGGRRGGGMFGSGRSTSRRDGGPIPGPSTPRSSAGAKRSRGGRRRKR